MSTEEKDKFTGGCACGEVRFAFYGPIRSQVACHCRSCQYASGGGPAYVAAATRAEFRVTRGSPREHMTLSEEGNAVTRAFCGTCGSPLFSWSEATPEMIGIKVGALDDPARFRPRYELWTSEAQRWHRKHWFTLRFRRQPRLKPKTAASAD
ncbi:MAG: GFA family protein [Pseudomonadales bacterium]